ncbi:MAG TPA: hypothetical protein VF061_12095, partial [Gemmatimonadales bacterium]
MNVPPHTTRARWSSRCFRRRGLGVLLLVLGATACGREAAPPGERAAQPSGAGPIGTRAAAQPMLPPGADQGEWTIPARDYGSTRFSPLDQITADNVGRLRLAWSFSTGVLRGH